MIELKNPKLAIPVVLFAGILWSFGALVVRYMDDPHLFTWQYIFGRGVTIFILLNLYLYFEEGINFYKNYFKIGLSGIIGGSGLGIAMITFIYSITNTTAAVTLLCLAAMPFFTALLAFLFLKETISINVWISIFIATVGIIIMALGNDEKKMRFNQACRLLGLFNVSKNEWESLKKRNISISENYILEKIEERNKAKKKGNFSLADKIREELSSKGILIEDQKEKTVWKIK